MSKEMREQIDNFKKFLLNENIKRSVTDLIIDELNRWENEYGIKTCDVNTGDCFVFAEKMEGILKMNGYKDVEVLTTDLFYDLATEDAKHDEEIFYNEQDYNSFKPLGFEWVKNGYHGWIYVNGKHYDAEEVNGVENFYDLPIFHRHIKRDISNEKSVDVEFNKIKLSKFNSLRNLTLQDIVDNWTNVQNMKNDNIDTITYFINNQSELNTKCLSYDKNGLADGYHRLIAMKILNIKTFCYNYEDEYSGD